MTKKTKNILLLIVLTLPTTLLAGSNIDSIKLSSNNGIADVILVVTLIGGILTILSYANKNFPNKKSTDGDSDVIKDSLVTKYEKLGDKIRDIEKFDTVGKVQLLDTKLTKIEKQMNDYVVIKLQLLSENVNKIETRLNYIEDSSTSQKKELSTLSAYLREDINEVKSIIMNLLLALNPPKDHKSDVK
jgi:hypothetical protein